ncbi:MAG TPA: type II toxin-antitoxin system RelE/ParE family toxin [Paludibacter sp.]|nr:type II toxin-antitoxin system RelE/ParE family toxin [Paludibacter sp.]
MLKEIIWSPLSVSDMENTIEYLSNIWNEQIINEFLDDVDLNLQQIALYPRLYPVINKKLKVRKCVVTKHNTIFYQEKKNTIQLLRIFDTRQDPEKLKFK